MSGEVMITDLDLDNTSQYAMNITKMLNSKKELVILND